MWGWNGITFKFLEVFKVILFEIVMGHSLSDLAVVNYFRKKTVLDGWIFLWCIET